MLYPDLNGHFLEIRRLPGAVQNFCRSIDEAVRIASADKTRNVYFGVALRSDQKGNENHAALMPALWADLDVVKDFGGDWRKAGEVLAAFELSPSIVIQTGNGWHIYWAFREPEPVTPDNRLQLRGCLLGLAKALGGDPNCRDLSRLLRVPNTTHAKNGDGKACFVKECSDPKPVRVIRWYPDRRYNLSDFDPWYVEDTAGGNGAVSVNLDDVPAELSERFTKRLDTDTELRAAWEGKRKPPIDKSRSGFDAMLAGMLVVRDFSDSEIAAVLQHYPHGKGKEATRAYLSRTILHAKTYVTAGGNGPETDVPSDADEEADEKHKRPSQADRLIKLALQDAILFHDQTQTPYALVNVAGHYETLRCQGRAFRRWMSRKLYEAEEKAPSGEALSAALNVIEAKATFDGERHELHNRVAYHDDAICYNLTDERRRTVRVTPLGWQIIDNPPILFVRHDQ